MQNNFYETSPVKRKRATKAEMIERANFVADFTREFAPVTVRQVFYAATVNKIIEKTGFDEVMVIDDSLLSGPSSEYNSIKDAIQYKNR